MGEEIGKEQRKYSVKDEYNDGRKKKRSRPFNVPIRE